MKKYIDAVSAAELIARKMGVHLCDMVDMMADVPPADVAEVVHGEWIPIIDEYSMYPNISFLHGYTCSLCGRTEEKKEPYCDCGAKMDSEKEGI